MERKGINGILNVFSPKVSKATEKVHVHRYIGLIREHNKVKFTLCFSWKIEMCDLFKVHNSLFLCSFYSPPPKKSPFALRFPPCSFEATIINQCYVCRNAKNKAKLKCKQWQLLAIKYLFLANLSTPEGLTYIYFFTRLKSALNLQWTICCIWEVIAKLAHNFLNLLALCLCTLHLFYI